jgi:hypothetical protein
MMTPQEVKQLVESKAEGLEVRVTRVLRKMLHDQAGKYLRYYFTVALTMHSDDGFVPLTEIVRGFENPARPDGVWAEEGNEYDFFKSSNNKSEAGVSWNVTFDLVCEYKR